MGAMRAILDLMLPPACAACGSAGALLCSACLSAARPASDPACRFVAPDPAIAIGQDLSLALAAFAFEGPIRKALARLKYEGASRLAGPLAQAAIPTLRILLQMTGAVPLGPGPRAPGAAPGARLQPGRAHRASARFRGRAARHRSSRARAPDDEATSAGPCSATREPAGGVLGASGSHRAMPAAVIVVDDIVTTTATLEACASVLRSAGVREVYGFAVAREI